MRDFLLCLVVLYTLAVNCYVVGMLAGWHIAWLRSHAGTGGASGLVDSEEVRRLLKPPPLWPGAGKDPERPKGRGGW